MTDLPEKGSQIPIEPEQKIAESTNEPQKPHEKTFSRRTKAATAGVLAGLALSLSASVSSGESEDSKPEQTGQEDTAAEVVGENFPDELLSRVDLNEMGRNTVDVMTQYSPYMLLAGGAFVGGLALSRNRLDQSKLRLANRGLDYNNKNRLQSAFAGTLIPAIGAIALTTSFSIEEEIRTGPNRVISAIEADISDQDDNRDLYWVLQDDTDYFMNTSSISFDDKKEQKNFFAQAENNNELDILPFHLDLTEIDMPQNHRHNHQPALVIGAPSEDKTTPSPIYPETETSDCMKAENSCVLESDELIIDTNEGINIGDTITVRGEEYNVAGLAKDSRSLLNRLAVFTSQEGVERFRKSDDNSYYGLAVEAESLEDIEELLQEFGMDDSQEILSTEELLDNNSEFWEGNGTTLMMLLIMNISAFGGISMYERKRAEQEYNRSDIATLRSLGMSVKDIAQIDFARATITTAKASIPVMPVSYVVSEMSNVGIAGFNSEIDSAMVAGAAGTILTAKTAGVALLTKRLRKISPAENLDN